MAETINYEALRARHAADTPLRALTDKELEAITDAGDAELRDLSFLARLELGARHALVKASANTACPKTSKPSFAVAAG